MRIHNKVVEGSSGDKYIILFEYGKIDTPLCIISEYGWKNLSSEVFANMLNFGDDRED